VLFAASFPVSPVALLRFGNQHLSPA